jgi:hypothetical protein
MPEILFRQGIQGFMDSVFAESKRFVALIAAYLHTNDLPIPTQEVRILL